MLSPISLRSRVDKCKSRVASNRKSSRVERGVLKRCGREDVSKIIRCRFLKQVIRNVKRVTKSSLKPVHKQKILKWPEEYIKTDLSTLLPTDECRVTLDWPDGWHNGWVSINDVLFVWERGNVGVMFWVGIVCDMSCHTLMASKMPTQMALRWHRKHILPSYSTIFSGGSKVKSLHSREIWSFCKITPRLMQRNVLRNTCG